MDADLSHHVSGTLVSTLLGKYLFYFFLSFKAKVHSSNDCPARSTEL